MVGNLRNMAIDMSTEVSNQNRQLDRIADKAQSNEVRVESANKRANKLLTKWGLQSVFYPPLIRILFEVQVHNGFCMC